MPSRSFPSTDALLAETRWLRAVARGLVRDGGSPEDLAQDVMLDALEHRPSSDGGGLRGWLRTVARRRAGRIRSRRRVASDAEWQAARPEVAPTEESLSSHDRLVLHEELARAIASLPASDRNVVIWRYFDERDTAWIARELGVSPPAARKRLSRALVRLRTKLDGTERGGEAWALALDALAAPPSGSLIPDLGASSSGELGAALPSSIIPAAIIAMTATKLAAAAAVVLAAVWMVTALDRDPAPASGLTVDANVADVDPKLAPLQVSAETAESRRSADAVSVLDEMVQERAPPVLPPRLHVVDESGVSIPMATAAWLDREVRAHDLTVDELGFAELPSREHLKLFVTCEGFMAGHRVVEPLGDEDVVEVVLVPARTISGFVLVDGGPPPPSLSLLGSVNISSVGLTTAAIGAAQALRDIGAFPESPRIQPAPGGAFHCRIEHPAESVWFYTSSGFSPRAVTVDSEPQPARGMRFRVPVGAERVEIDLESRPAISGRFVWAGTDEAVDGDFFYSVEDEEGYGIGGSTSEELMRDGHFWVAVDRRNNSDDEDEPLKRGAQISLEVFHPEARGRFRHVVDLEGVTVPLDLGSIEVPRLTSRRLRVVERTSGGFEPIIAALVSSEGRTKTDANGEASLFVSQDDFVDVFSPGYAFVRESLASLTAEADGTLHIVLDRAPALRLRAESLEQGENARAAPRVRVRFEGASPYGIGPTEGERPVYHYFHHRQFYPRGRGSLVLVQMGNRQVDYYVPRDGHVDVHGLRPGATVLVELCDPFDQVLASAPVAMGEEDQTIEMETTATASLTCTVDGVDGEPVEGVTVEIRGTTGRSLHLGIDGGLVDLGPFAPGSYEVSAKTRDGRSVAPERIELGPGPTTIALVLD